MALWDRVKERYSAQYLTNLTRPDLTDATTPDDVIGGRAATDVEGDLEVSAGIAYDETDKRIVSAAVEGVILKLLMRNGANASQVLDLARQWDERLEALARVTGRNRLLPRTTSEVEPSREKVGTETVRPVFDTRRFAPFTPGAPPAGEEED